MECWRNIKIQRRGAPGWKIERGRETEIRRLIKRSEISGAGGGNVD